MYIYLTEKLSLTSGLSTISKKKNNHDRRSTFEAHTDGLDGSFGMDHDSCDARPAR